MKETYCLMPVLAGDVSGIAGALYELGGMVIIDDPSGCNSTFNTHDELRWFHERSDIYISGLNMRDAIIGNDKKLIDDIIGTADKMTYKPGFIALSNSPVPYLTGRDYEGISRLLEKKLDIPVFYVPSNGCHDYIRGAGMAWTEFLKKFSSLISKKKKNDNLFRLNIAGMMPLDYGNRRSLHSLKELLSKAGFEINSVFSMNENYKYEKTEDRQELFNEILRCGEADLTLVISSSGIMPAEYLKRKFGVPYIAGVPFEVENDPVIRKIEAVKAAVIADRDINDYRTTVNESIIRESDEFEKNKIINLKTNEFDKNIGINSGNVEILDTEIKRSDRKLLIISEPVLGLSLAEYAGRCRETIVIDPTESDFNQTGESVKLLKIRDEETLERFVSENGDFDVISDPEYFCLFSDKVKKISMPALSVSGRIYRNEFIDYFRPGQVRKLLCQ